MSFYPLLNGDLREDLSDVCKNRRWLGVSFKWGNEFKIKWILDYLPIIIEKKYYRKTVV